MKSWGIDHDTPERLFTVTDEDKFFYIFDDITIPNDTAKVLRPAWWLEKEGTKICISIGTAELQ